MECTLIKSRGICRFLRMVLLSSTMKKERMQIKRRKRINKQENCKTKNRKTCTNSYLSLMHIPLLPRCSCCLLQTSLQEDCGAVVLSLLSPLHSLAQSAHVHCALIEEKEELESDFISIHIQYYIMSNTYVCGVVLV